MQNEGVTHIVGAVVIRALLLKFFLDLGLLPNVNHWRQCPVVSGDPTSHALTLAESVS